MARPKKVGLEYFSLDVKMDDEVELIKGKHGMEGFGVLISMFQTIYGDKGYYYLWTEREQILFSNKVSVDRNFVVTIINDCIKWDIFNKEMYETHQILTSKRIQDQYISATYKRAEVKIREDYLLVEKNDRENIIYIGVSDNENQETTKDSDDINSQSNKESKVKESNNTNIHTARECEEENSKSSTNTIRDAMIQYWKVAAVNISSAKLIKLKEYANKMSVSVVIEAMRRARFKDDPFTYLFGRDPCKGKGLLNKWLDKEVTSISDIQELDQEHQQKNSQNTGEKTRQWL